MRRRLISCTTLSLLIAAGAAMAEPATPEGAKAMAGAYAAYFSSALLDQGILAIAAQGDDYVVTWDLAKALEGGKPEAQQVKISPFVYRVTPTLDGGWLARADALPKVSIGPTKPDSSDGGEIAFDGFRFEGLYDPEAADFFRSKLALGALKVDVRSKAAKQMQHVVLLENGISGELRVRPGEDGAVDVSMTQSLASATGKTTVSGEA